MLKKQSPFHKQSKDEKDELVKQAANLAKLRKEAEQLAMKCVNSSIFVKYKTKYELLQKTTIDSLIDYEEPDPLKYAFGCRTALVKLHQLRLLLTDVTVDSKVRGKK